MPIHRTTATLYDRLSGWYDWLSSPAEQQARLGALELLAAQPGERVLEIGCGPGGLLPRLAGEAGEAGFVLGLDLSQGMLRVAERNTHQSAPGLTSRISLVRADARSLPLGNHQFEAILMSFTLELFCDQDIPLVLAECRRVLKPGGRLCLLSLNRPRPAPIAVKIYNALRDLFPRWIDCRPIELSTIIEANGFTVARSRIGSIFGLPVVSVLSNKILDSM